MQLNRHKRLLSTITVLAAAAIFLHMVTKAHARDTAAVPSLTMPLAYSYINSPNFNDRPLGGPINCIVLHATVEPTTQGTIDIFLNPVREVSAHFVVGRDGRVVQMVPIEKRAWHAGVSVLEGTGNVNDFSVGIEMVNLNDGKDPYPLEQMEAVAGLIRFIRSRYNVPDSRIVSHAQIALPQGRKSDPLGFDFEKIKSMAHESVVTVPLDLSAPQIPRK